MSPAISIPVTQMNDRRWCEPGAVRALPLSCEIMESEFLHRCEQT